MTTDELLVLVALMPVLLAQGLYLFIDARKRGRYPWLWGLWGLIQAPTPLVVYLIVVRKIYKNWRRTK
ncbi:MAG: hypothetical protein K0R57_6301 [Paenibacillaceae bacterium]|jgi:hypothetical protein|nr:hypothetical protein [Paenibacillaceae bacterium]